MVYRRLFFLLGFSFCCFNLGPASPEEGYVFLILFFFSFLFFEEFLHFDWPRDVSSVASSGSFLDLAFVQFILRIVVILLIEKSPYLDYGWTFSFHLLLL